MDEIKDKEIICRECGSAFIWTAGEQEFFSDKGLVNIPTRCPICRKKRSVKHDFGTLYDITCSVCGKKAKSPFKPELPEEAICHDCFIKLREEEEKKERGQEAEITETTEEPAPPPAFEKPEGEGKEQL